MIITVKPRPGLILHNPGNFMRLIDAEGEPVVNSAYWQRRIADGDAILITENPSTPQVGAPSPPQGETKSPDAAQIAPQPPILGEPDVKAGSPLAPNSGGTGMTAQVPAGAAVGDAPKGGV